MPERLSASVPVFAGCDFTAIFPGTRLNPHAPSGNHPVRTIIATGQPNPNKGHAHLLEALAALMGRGYGSRCIIVGTGRDEGALKACCRAFGLEDRVEWIIRHRRPGPTLQSGRLRPAPPLRTPWA